LFKKGNLVDTKDTNQIVKVDEPNTGWISAILSFWRLRALLQSPFSLFVLHRIDPSTLGNLSETLKEYELRRIRGIGK
jgi:hypothetical protein